MWGRQCSTSAAARAHRVGSCAKCLRVARGMQSAPHSRNRRMNHLLLLPSPGHVVSFTPRGGPVEGLHSRRSWTTSSAQPPPTKSSSCKGWKRGPRERRSRWSPMGSRLPAQACCTGWRRCHNCSRHKYKMMCAMLKAAAQCCRPINRTAVEHFTARNGGARLFST